MRERLERARDYAHSYAYVEGGDGGAPRRRAVNEN